MTEHDHSATGGDDASGKDVAERSAGEEATRKTSHLDVGPPRERVDDETPTDKAKTTQRQE